MLKEAVTVRNVLAHQIIDPSQESKDSFFEMDTLTYLRFRKSTDVCKISKRDVAETERILVKSNEYLSDIYENY